MARPLPYSHLSPLFPPRASERSPADLNALQHVFAEVESISSLPEATAAAVLSRVVPRVLEA